MKLRKISAALYSSGLLLLVGCESLPPQSQFLWDPYEEPQKNWPTQETALVHKVDGFPIYELNQLPANPYDVLGFVFISKVASPDLPAGIDEQKVVKEAQAHNGEAAIITRRNLPSTQAHFEHRDYLVIRFKKNPLHDAVKRIETFLNMTAGSANGYDGPDFRGNLVHYTAAELTTQRSELQKQKELIIASPAYQRELGDGSSNNPIPERK